MLNALFSYIDPYSLILAILGLLLIARILKVERNVEIPIIWTTILGFLAFIPAVFSIIIKISHSSDGEGFGFFVLEYFYIYLLVALLLVWWYGNSTIFSKRIFLSIFRVLFSFIAAFLIMMFSEKIITDPQNNLGILIFWTSLIVIY